jgi:hypothetical protein
MTTTPNPRTADEFRRQAKAKALWRWVVHRCAVCGYPHGFRFTDDRVAYDGGCLCAPQPVREADWHEVADHYNLQTDPDAIRRDDEFWGFGRSAED